MNSISVNIKRTNIMIEKIVLRKLNKGSVQKSVCVALSTNILCSVKMC